MYEVLGRLLDTLINMVVNTSIDVKLTVITASKKNGLKKFVMCPIRLRRIVGKKMVKKVPRRRRPNVTETTIPALPISNLCHAASKD